ncbi:hypothetical protein ACO0SA_001587 [Hanseniaspora valbyensis]
MISDNELYSLTLKFGICLFVLIIVYGFISVNFLEQKEGEFVEEPESDELLEEVVLEEKQTKKGKK